MWSNSKDSPWHRHISAISRISAIDCLTLDVCSSHWSPWHVDSWFSRLGTFIIYCGHRDFWRGCEQIKAKDLCRTFINAGFQWYYVKLTGMCLRITLTKVNLKCAFYQHLTPHRINKRNISYLLTSLRGLVYTSLQLSGKNAILSIPLFQLTFAKDIFMDGNHANKFT